MFFKVKKETAFTLIELIIVITVIGVISSFASVYFSQMKRNSRDYKRLSDITELQIVLEKYKFFEGTYPPALFSPLVGPTTGKIFLEKIPINEKYLNSICPLTTYDYISDGNIYYLNFCLEGNIENYKAGLKCAYSGGIKDGNCSLY